MKIKYLLFCLGFLSGGLWANPNTFAVICPVPALVSVVTEQGSLRYRAHTFVDLPELNYRLEMTGVGGDVPAKVFQAATWTDHTFLCNYNISQDAVVIFELVLANYVKRCYFENTKHYAECKNPDPKQCPLICERKVA